MTPVTQVSPIDAEILLIAPTNKLSIARTLAGSLMSDPAGTDISRFAVAI